MKKAGEGKECSVELFTDVVWSFDMVFSLFYKQRREIRIRGKPLFDTQPWAEMV